MILDLKMLFQKYNFKLTGVLHIGAHVGQELDFYQQMHAQKVVCVEANPKVFEKLVEVVKTYPNVQAVCCAISDKNGKIPFYITSNTESSSILKLKYHAKIYSNIVETECIEVNSYTIDNLIKSMNNIEPSDFNFINIDIQGAELLAFQGATNLLEHHIKVISTEINYKELYKSCGLKDDLDKFLGKFGFVCKEISCHYHPSWGDAFYVKE